jgi:hypothetical protein
VEASHGPAELRAISRRLLYGHAAPRHSHARCATRAHGGWVLGPYRPFGEDRTGKVRSSPAVRASVRGQMSPARGHHLAGADAFIVDFRKHTWVDVDDWPHPRRPRRPVDLAIVGAPTRSLPPRTTFMSRWSGPPVSPFRSKNEVRCTWQLGGGRAAGRHGGVARSLDPLGESHHHPGRDRQGT